MAEKNNEKAKNGKGQRDKPCVDYSFTGRRSKGETSTYPLMEKDGRPR